MVRPCTSCRVADGNSQWVHRPYLLLTTSRFVVPLPSTYDSRLFRSYVWIRYIYIRKSVFLKVKGGSSIVPAHLPTSNEPGQSSSARCPAVWGPYDNESPDLCHLPIQWPTWPISSLGGALVDSVHVASAVIKRIAPQGSHCYCWRGHNTIVLHNNCICHF